MRRKRQKHRIDTSDLAIPKRHPERDPAFRKWISEQPCMFCGIEGATQAAHLHRYGQKSKGQKVCDSQIRPLCHAGAKDCHGRLDRHENEWEEALINEALDMPVYELWKQGKAEKAARLMGEF